MKGLINCIQTKIQIWFNRSFVNVGIATGIYFAIGTSSGAFILLQDFKIIWNNSVTPFLFEEIDLGLLIVSWWRLPILVQYLKT